MNVVIVGAVSDYLPIPRENLLESIKALVPQKTIEVGLKALICKEKSSGNLKSVIIMKSLFNV